MILSSSNTVSGTSQINKRSSRKELPALIPHQDTNHLHPHIRSPGVDSDLGSSISKTVSDSRPHTSWSRLQSHPPCVSSPAIFVIDQSQSPGPDHLVTSSADIRRWSDNFTNTSSNLCPNCSQNLQHSFWDQEERSRNKPKESQAKYLVKSSSKSLRARPSPPPSGHPLFSAPTGAQEVTIFVRPSIR